MASVTLPTTITELGNYIFDDCYNLKSLSIPDAVTRLGYGCFRWTGIETLTIPTNVTSIGSDCFNSSNLKKLRMLPTTPPTCDGSLGLPSDATIYVDDPAIDTYQTTEPWSNYNIENPDGFPIGEATVGELKYRLYPNYKAELIANDYNMEGEFNVPSTFQCEGDVNTYTVTAIGKDCFNNCNNITNIVIPGTIIELGDYAFQNCSSIKTLSLPESVTKIGEACFRWSGIELITIPASVTFIGSDCFNIGNFIKLRMMPTTPPTCNGGLGLPSDATIYVDDSAITTYKGTEPWSNYNIENPDGFPIGEATVGELKYRLYPNNKAELIANDYNREGEFNIPSTFQYESDGNEYTVTAIGARCFSDCYNITNIVIPETVTTIGKCAFRSCSALTSIKIPNGVTKIPNECFDNCQNLTNVILPSSITELGNSCFTFCHKLTTLTIPEFVTTIGDGCFILNGIETLTIPASVTLIGNNCFGNDILKNIRMCSPTPPTCSGDLGLPSDATIYVDETAIATYTVAEPWSNYNIENADDFPEEVVVDELKYRIYSDEKVELLANNYVKEGVFTIPETFLWNEKIYTVSVIGVRCFANCNTITSIIIPGTIREIRDYAFAYCNSLNSITISDGVTKIDKYAFYECYNLSNISLSSTITELGDCAFQNCSNIKTLSLPESVTKIGEACFRWSGIEMLTIPASVTSIGSDCFNSGNLKKLRMMPTNPPTCNGDLGLRSEATIYVDKTAIETYKGIEPWSNYNIENPDGFPIAEVIVSECKYWIYNNGMAELLSYVNDQNRELIIPETIEYEGKGYTVVELIDECLRNYSSRSIILPSTIKKIGRNCFNWNLQNLVILSQTPPTCHEEGLGDINNDVVIYTDNNCISTYQASSAWAGYTYKANEEFFLERVPMDDFTYNIYMFNGYAEVTGYNNTEGTDYEIPENISFNGADYVVNKICSSSLSWNNKITSIIIPESITLTDESFQGCDKLKTILCLANTPPVCTYGLNFNSNATIYVNNNVISTYNEAEHWGNYAIESLDYFSILSTAKNGELKYRLYTFSNKATLINNNYRFAGKVELPQTVTHEDETYTLTTLGDNCFYTCSDITEVVLPNTVTTLGKGALEYCSSMKEFTLPENVTSIGQNCLKGCNNLIGLKCMATTPPTINTSLGLKTSVPVYVPSASIEAYKAADIWKDYDIRSIDNYDSAIHTPMIDGFAEDVKTYDLNGFRLGNAKGKGLRILRSKGRSKKVVY